MPYTGVKRRVFISYYHADQKEVDAFIKKWSEDEKVFSPRAIGISDNDDLIDSTNTDYVMNQIRTKYLGDSTVTIVLIGKCTHSRRYVDWEIKSSLRQGSYTPNGLIGILLPSMGDRAHLPPRFKANWNKDDIDSYARYYASPTSANQLGGWIEDAFEARTSRCQHIKNTDMLKYNAKCAACNGITH